MKVTVFAAGSQGDIQPCCALAKGLQQAGYQVRFAAPLDFAEFIRGHGLEFAALRGDVRALMAGETGRKFMETGGANPLKSILAVRKMIAPVIMDMAEDVFAACRDADALVCLGVFGAFGQSIAEALGIPQINIEPTPLLPTRAFPAPSWPIQKNLGGLHNRLSGRLMLQVVWLWYQPFVNELRRRLQLPPCSAQRFQRDLMSTPLIGAYSPTLIPHPPDWPQSVHITGCLFLEPRTDWQPSPQLQAFLEAGAAPVYIGFGSMGGRSPEKLAALAQEALALCGQRGVLLTGWGGMRPASPAEHVFVLDSAPHRWLFPRMAALVHHGGAGTTAEGLRAGVPSVVTPFILDQPFWGARLHALGLGPQPIPQKRLSAARLAEAIHTAVTDGEMRRRARRAGEAVRAEDGIANAVQAVRSHLG